MRWAAGGHPGPLVSGLWRGKGGSQTRSTCSTLLPQRALLCLHVVPCGASPSIGIALPDRAGPLARGRRSEHPAKRRPPALGAVCFMALVPGLSSGAWPPSGAGLPGVPTPSLGCDSLGCDGVQAGGLNWEAALGSVLAEASGAASSGGSAGEGGQELPPLVQQQVGRPGFAGLLHVSVAAACALAGSLGGPPGFALLHIRALLILRWAALPTARLGAVRTATPL